ncbi:MAG: TIGR04282 family arsenosugar biosynthesis glycosyltransferase [Candidatus Poribacteria bacterium]
MNEPDERCLLFFMKYPEKGRVKTRLAREIGAIVTVELYKNFVLDLLSTLEKLGMDLWVCFYPKNSREKLMGWLGKQYCYMPQKGADLGQRMKNSFLQAFDKDYHRVVVIGSDSPDLPSAFINQAFSYLETNDVVIGPAFDGGYYLIGFRANAFLPEAFEGINWSADTVFRETMNILEMAKLKIYVLPKWSDVDTLRDVKNLIQRNQDTEFRHSKTVSYILNNEIF